MSSYALGLVFSVLVLVVIFLRLRNARMQERYATWWVVIALFVLAVSVFPSLLSWLAGVFGIVVPLNLAFFLAGVVLLLMSLQFSVDLSHASDQQRRLVEEVALLRLQIETLGEREAGPTGGACSCPTDDGQTTQDSHDDRS